MIKWQIIYWVGAKANPVEKWLLKLPKDHFKSVAKELRILEEIGNETSTQ